MKPGDNLYLVGMMGAGKTTVGKIVARRLKRRFVDSDQEIERRCGVRVPVIFDIEGEQGFRVREEQAITEMAAHDGVVLAFKVRNPAFVPIDSLVAGSGLRVLASYPGGRVLGRAVDPAR